MSCESLFAGPLHVVNIGLEGFADELHAAGVDVVHVDWRPPSGGNPRMAALLLSLEEDD
jgi:FdrA protein